MAVWTGARRVVGIAVIAGGAVFAAGSTAQGYPEEDALRIGRQAAAVFMDDLDVKLRASMKISGPAGAARVCEYQTQALAGEVVARHGVTIRRTSLRLRSPANAPDAHEREILEQFEAQARSGGGVMSEAMLKRRDDGRAVWHYARPVAITPLCLPCHGTPAEIPEEVQDILRQKYPADRAGGYRQGEMRGIVSVVIPAE